MTLQLSSKRIHHICVSSVSLVLYVKVNAYEVTPHSVCVCVCSMLEYDTENMNSEEIFSSLRGVTEAIQSFSFRSQEDILEPIKRDGKKEDTVSATTCKTVFKMLLQHDSS